MRERSVGSFAGLRIADHHGQHSVLHGRRGYRRSYRSDYWGNDRSGLISSVKSTVSATSERKKAKRQYYHARRGEQRGAHVISVCKSVLKVKLGLCRYLCTPGANTHSRVVNNPEKWMCSVNYAVCSESRRIAITELVTCDSYLSHFEKQGSCRLSPSGGTFYTLYFSGGHIT